MFVENITEDGYKTRILQRKTFEISSLLNEFPTSTNILVVDTNIVTLLDMKKAMKQYAYQVTVYADAEEALSFLINCKHEINIVIWDFHMPGINGLQALEIIGSKMDLPVVIMSDDNQIESVMRATIHGACDYVMKPVREDVIANIWRHIVRKRMMSEPNLVMPVQLDHVQTDGLGQKKDSSNIVYQDDGEQNIDKKEERATKKPRITWTEEIQPVQSELVQTKGLDQEKKDSKIINQKNGEQNIDKKEEKKARKPRLMWTGDLQQKFLEAIEIVGGVEKANPKLLLKCLQDMNVKGLTRNNVSSHLQKHRINLEENQIPQQTREISWSTTCRPLSPQSPNNAHTAISYLMNGQAVNPIQHNQYQNGYLKMSNGQFMTNSLPRLPYFDHNHFQQQQQQQQYQFSHQLNYMTSKKEPEQVHGIDVTDSELIYPSLPYDPKEFLIEGYNYNQ